MDQLYNSEFFKTDCGLDYREAGHWNKFFGDIADRIVEIFNPSTVLDAGCAFGYLVKALRDRGVEAYGFDISEYAISMSDSSIKDYVAVHSITEPLPENFPSKFDLIITIEVLEHLFPEDGQKAIKNLCNYSDTIIFTSTDNDIDNRTHYNVRLAEYWAKQFAENSFYHDLVQNVDFICPWAMLFRKKSSFPEVVFDYELNKRIDEFYFKKAMAEALSAKDGKCATLYFDCGVGLSESNKKVVDYSGKILNTGRVALPQGCKAVRFDPVEDNFSIVTRISAIGSNGQIKFRPSNPCYENDIVFFETNDPQYMSEKLHGQQWVEIECEILTFSDVTTFYAVKSLVDSNKSAEEEINNKIAEYAALKAESEKAQNELREYRRQVAERENMLRAEAAERENMLRVKAAERENMLRAEAAERENMLRVKAAERENLLRADAAHWQNMYNGVLCSRSWRITKPLRKITSALRRNKVTYYFCKGLVSLKRNGFRVTWRKVRNKLSSKKRRDEYQKIYPEIGKAAAQEVVPVAEDIKFSVLVPLYNTDERFLREMIASVIDQTYSNWELCLADGSDENHGYVEKVVSEFTLVDKRVKYERLKENNGISANTNECAGMASGDYIALLDHDDLLAKNALLENARAIYETNADVLYSDEDHLSVAGEHINPFFKPDWSPDLLYSQMYICHFLVFRRELFNNIGGFRSEFDGSQDYDLMLRMSENTDKICHIPIVLYTWRECETSTALNADAKPYAYIAGRNALDSHLKRKYGDCAHGEESGITFVYDARFDILNNALVSIIIPMKDKWELTDACVNSIIEKSTYSNYEIIILDNRSTEQSTFDWFKKITERDKRVKVFDADMEFNWSKINNFGISRSEGDVYIFLNNDTVVITPDWIERLCENAMRDDIGAVGPLLLYEDDTIQHAGVVVGINGWADHVFKGISPVHYMSPFVSPMVSRNVLAVTGACMAVSKKTIEKIGGFDETFIICGSDIELCIRAYENGLFNRYDANVRLYHLESKSRDSYIPEEDFSRSYECYTPYRENVDPFFNINLDITAVVPKARCIDMSLLNFKNFLKCCPVTVPAYNRLRQAVMVPQSYSIAEIQPIMGRTDSKIGQNKRLNLLVPSVDIKHVFGGISTALKFFETLKVQSGLSVRIIVLDAPVDTKTIAVSSDYIVVAPDTDSTLPMQIIPFADRSGRTLSVGENDVFVATAWWTAYNVKGLIKWQADTFGKNNSSLIYFIQDYEPGFYSWSSRYMLADSTYRLPFSTYAVINSDLLKDYLIKNEYSFNRYWSFEPTLNEKLAVFLPKDNSTVRKKKVILVYGRPSTDRNAFSLLVLSLKLWRENCSDADEWSVISAGEQHGDVDLGGGLCIHSVGKLSLEDYAKTMLDAYAGVSLMVSPHPSYPPLEMAAFGVKVITNRYANKDLSSFSGNISSLVSCSPNDVADELLKICSSYSGEGTVMTDHPYLKAGTVFADISDDLIEELGLRK